MSFFSKFFGKGETPEPLDLKPTAELMAQDQYWRLVEDSIKNSVDQETQLSYLVASLRKLSPAEMVGFRLRTDKLLFDTYNSEMWCAGYLMNGGCSDDGFEYFRLWVISRGRDVYEMAKADPDSLIAVADVEVPEGLFDLESFWYVALTAFENKTGKQLYDYIDYDNFNWGESNYPQIDFTWQEDDPESMMKICPRLFERFGINETA